MEERTVSLIGAEGYRRLTESRVIVFGAGGVGGYLIEALVRAGIGGLVIIDGDVFAKSNLNRQILAVSSTIGISKAEAAKDRARSINPLCEITAIHKMLKEGDIPGILDGGADFVCDAVDDVPVKTAIAAGCFSRKIPLISCMGAGNRIGIMPFEIADIFSTQGDPLAKAMRKRLRDAGVTELAVCYSRELPYAAGKTPPASISYVPAMAGLTMAGHVIRRLAGIDGAPKG